MKTLQTCFYLVILIGIICLPVQADTQDVSIEITSPADGSTFDACIGEIEFSFTTDAATEAIESIRLYRNDIFLARLRNVDALTHQWRRPYSGFFKIHAELEDTSGAVYQSEPITLKIGNAVDGNLIANGEFDCNTISPWNFVAWSGASASKMLDSLFNLSIPPALYIEFDPLPQGAADWNVQLYQSIVVDSGAIYDISFKAEVIQEKDITIGVQTNDGSNTILWETVTINAPGTYNYEFTPDQTLAVDSKFLLALSTDDTPIALDNVKFIRRDDGMSVSEQSPQQPLSFLTTSNYPNPFNPSTTIQFNVSESARVFVDVFNMQGQKVATLLDQRVSQGQHEISWNGADQVGNPVGSGVYLYVVRAELRASTLVQSQKMVLIR